MQDNNISPQYQDYYSKTSRKVIDFIIGFMGFFVAAYILYYLVFFGSFVSSGPIYAAVMWTLMIMFPIIILILANTAIKKNRRYITRGINWAIIFIILIPLLLFGACWIAISNYGR
jgi:uncharacterized membrane protein YhaH (DUF805 family)